MHEQQVRDFMRCRGLYTADELSEPPLQVQQDRVRVMLEELFETVQAIHEGNIVKVADGLGDLIYVAIGTAIAYGIPIGRVFDEIHRSNMTKGPLDAQGKGGKGPGYEPARILEAIYGLTGPAKNDQPIT